jgi:hypothetical protein
VAEPASSPEAQAAVTPASPPAGHEGPPRSTRIDIRILDDGRVVFGDLPPELAEVAAILGGGEAVACALPGVGEELPP